MKIFKAIEFNIAKEREHINSHYNKRERKALLKLCDLFEAGEWQKCLDHVNNPKAFPYNKRGEYPEVEHICIPIADILHCVPCYNFYTKAQLKAEIKEEMKNDAISKE